MNRNPHPAGRRRAAAAAAAALAMAAAVVTAAAPAAARPAGQAAGGPQASVAAAARPSAAAAALATATATRHAVPVTSATTATSTTVANPNGTFTMTTDVLPVRTRVHGAWRAVTAGAAGTPDSVSECNTTSENETESCQKGFVETQGGSGCTGYKNWGKEQGAKGYNGNGIGYNADTSAGCAGPYRAYYVFNTSTLDSGMHIISAVLTAYDNYGASWGCPDEPIYLDLTDAKALGANTDWQNQPGDASGDQQRTAHVSGGPNPSSRCKAQTPQFTVQYAMAMAAAGNEPELAFMFTGNENSDGDGFLRLGDNPHIVTTFDRNPKTPASLTTVPITAHSTPAGGYQACDPSNSQSDPVWLGQDSGIALSASIAPNVSNEGVRAEYTVWDDMLGGEHLPQPDSNYYFGSGTAASTTDTPLGFSLLNGHFYGWTASSEVSGIPENSDGPYSTAAAGNCYFAVDTAGPGPVTVSSSAFPASGVVPDVDTAGDAGAFSFSASDPVPSGCQPGPCLASGVYEYVYSLDAEPSSQPPSTVGCTSGSTAGSVLATDPNSGGHPSPATSCSVQVSQWGTHTLYVEAFDRAGNETQAQYNFFVPWAHGTGNPAPGDINGDGIPDLLGTTSTDLLLYPGDDDPAAAATVAGPQAASPAGDGWSNYLITHRGSMSAGHSADDLFALHQTASGNVLYLYRNSGGTKIPGGTGTQDQFDSPQNITVLGGGWSGVTQILAPGDAWLPPAQQTSSEALPSLFTVQGNGQLWLYPGQAGPSLGAGTELGSSGWNNMTLIAPGEVAGGLALWARDNTTGTLYSYPISIVNGQPTLDPSSPGTPVTATSGTVITGVSLPASGYPAVASPGPLDNSSYPGLYAEVTSGSSPAGSCATGCLYYYPGQSTSGGAPPLSGQRVFVGVLSKPVTQLS